MNGVKYFEILQDQMIRHFEQRAGSVKPAAKPGEVVFSSLQGLVGRAAAACAAAHCNTAGGGAAVLASFSLG